MVFVYSEIFVNDKNIENLTKEVKNEPLHEIAVLSDHDDYDPPTKFPRISKNKSENKLKTVTDASKSIVVQVRFLKPLIFNKN